MSVLFLFQPQTRSGGPLVQPSSLKTTGPLHWTPTPTAISWGGKTKAQDIWQLRRELTGLRKRKTVGGVERKCSPGKWWPSVSQGLLMVHTEKQRISLYIFPASSFRLDHFPAPPPHPTTTTPVLHTRHRASRPSQRSEAEGANIPAFHSGMCFLVPLLSQSAHTRT